MFAEEGFLLIGVDNWGHGDRVLPDFETHFDPTSGHFNERFINAVKKTAIEIPPLIDSLERQDLIDASKLGLIGISMGSFISYKLLVEETRIKCASLFLGNPRWGDLPESPHLFADNIHPTALLTLLAGKDDVVPPTDAKAFHQELLPQYASSPERLKLVEYPESDHMMEEADWNAAVAETKQWFKQFI
jgi:dienelactone hydrolase